MDLHTPPLTILRFFLMSINFLIILKRLKMYITSINVLTTMFHKSRVKINARFN